MTLVSDNESDWGAILVRQVYSSACGTCTVEPLLLNHIIIWHIFVPCSHATCCRLQLLASAVWCGGWDLDTTSASVCASFPEIVVQRATARMISQASQVKLCLHRCCGAWLLLLTAVTVTKCP